jgi:Arc/MetJ family transcription regulator
MPIVRSASLMMDRRMCIFLAVGTHETEMRTNIDIDDALLVEAMEAAGLTTKKATVEASRQRKALKDLHGNRLGRGSRRDAQRMGTARTFLRNGADGAIGEHTGTEQICQGYGPT